jgi:hypothetical protein
MLLYAQSPMVLQALPPAKARAGEMDEAMKSTTLKAEMRRLDRAEILLIRTGQHLFREWQAKGRSDKDLEASYEKIWELKADLRGRKRELLLKMRPSRLSGVPGAS